MRDSVLQRHTERVMADRGEPPLVREVDGDESWGAFGWLRGTRDRAPMLELRKRDGSIMAVAYGCLERAEFDPSSGITLHVSGRPVTIRGRNLNAELRPNVTLFNGITRHRVPWVQEAGRAEALQAAESATVIEAIEW